MHHLMRTWVVILGIAAVVGVPAFAKKPESNGNGKAQNGNAQNSQKENSAHSPTHQDNNLLQNYFNLDRRNLITNYYADSRKSGKCPPGLAKKNNGCQPPGQIKKWKKGEPLPGDLVYYDLPTALLNQLGRTPEGEKLIQVGTDLLLISIGTGLVLDAFDFQE